MRDPKSVLMIVTSHARLGETDKPTGFWLEELAAPYAVFRDAGLRIDLASPAGGRPPADPKSETSDAEPVRRFLGDREAMAQLESTRRLADVAEGYDAYFVVGGHGVMWDLATSPEAAAIVSGRRVAAFSNEEEDAVGLTGVVPFALETRLRELGARYERGPKWSAFAVRDGKLVTGQNPQSSADTAREVLAALG